MSEFKIEKGVPMPTKAGKWTRLVSAMDIGDSVTVPTGSMATCISQAARAKGYKVISRQVEGGIRVWRTA